VTGLPKGVPEIPGDLSEVREKLFALSGLEDVRVERRTKDPAKALERKQGSRRIDHLHRPPNPLTRLLTPPIKTPFELFARLACLEPLMVRPHGPPYFDEQAQDLVDLLWRILRRHEASPPFPRRDYQRRAGR
jgi:hypothetical protein